MTASDQPVFIKVMNTLKRRAQRGRGTSIKEMCAAADRVLSDHTADSRDATLGAIAESRQAIAAWKVGGNNEILVQNLAKMAREAEDQGNVLGNPLLTQVGTRLGTFVRLFSRMPPLAAPNRNAVAAIELHLDAMLVAIDKGPHDMNEDSALELLRDLELTQRTIS